MTLSFNLPLSYPGIKASQPDTQVYSKPSMCIHVCLLHMYVTIALFHPRLLSSVTIAVVWGLMRQEAFREYLCWQCNCEIERLRYRTYNISIEPILGRSWISTCVSMCCLKALAHHVVTADVLGDTSFLNFVADMLKVPVGSLNSSH